MHRPAYMPLSSRNEEIRILFIEPGKRSDPLFCELKVVLLSQDPKYTALSYVWGDGHVTVPILVNDEDMRINQSLAVALLYLRHPNDRVVLWVDRLCINQGNAEEKEQQVQLMTKIYRNAVRTVIWLGESADNSELAMDFISNVETVVSQNWNDETFLKNMAPWKALKALMERPWWSRTWTIQEAYLSRLPIIKCGEKETHLENLVRLNEEYSEHFWTDLDRFNFGRPFDNVPFSTHLSVWHDTREMIQTEGGHILISWLGCSSRAQATLTRDKVFALFGLLRPKEQQSLIQEGIKPSYKTNADGTFQVPDRDIFKAVTAHNLKTSTSLYHLQSGRNPKTLDLPSWVVDYSTSTVDISDPLTSYTADGGSGGNDRWTELGCPQWQPNGARFVRLSADLEILTLVGVHFDKVEFVGQGAYVEIPRHYDDEQKQPIFVKRNHQLRGCMKDWQSQAFAWSANPYNTVSGARYEAFWRTLICDRLSDYTSLPPSSLGAGFEAWMEKPTVSSVASPEARTFGYAAIPRCHSRAFIITEKGYFGLAPRAAAVGDIVTVLRGGETPFVLRECGDFFQLVGAAYVHGIMNGEVTKTMEACDIREFELR